MSGELSWPNGARIAVAVTVMHETYSDGKWPTHRGSGFVKPGFTDHQALSWASYGGISGVWRIIRILDAHEVPATFCCSGRTAEVFPDSIEQIVVSGHDIAAHGYAQDILHAHLEPKDEQAEIRKTLDVLTAASGIRPKGWLTPYLAWSAQTDALLAEEKLLWRGDAVYIDLPTRVETPHGPIAHIPHCDFTDNKVLRLGSEDYFTTHKSTFDYLYRHEPMSYMTLTVHTHLGGRPLLSAQFNRLLDYITGQPDVWFARHSELAQWALANPTPSNAERFFR